MRKLAAIMFTDIVGYTALMGEDEAKALQLLQKNRGLLKPIIEQFHGEWLKEIGDGTLSSFNSAVEAVNCALAIQHVLKDDPDLKLRIGIHVGDVVFEEGDVFGDGVNIASRIEPLAVPPSSTTWIMITWRAPHPNYPSAWNTPGGPRSPYTLALAWGV
ncbi:MAG: adenylate/guanylate cyclase domain-containing protein [Candidatus Neomarinimicrobiota bacterium]